MNDQRTPRQAHATGTGDVIVRRLRGGGLPGLIGGVANTRSNAVHGGGAALTWFAVSARAGALVGLAAVVAYCILVGAVRRIRKRAAGVPLDSALDD